VLGQAAGHRRAISSRIRPPTPTGSTRSPPILISAPPVLAARERHHGPIPHTVELYAHRCQACLRLYQDPAVRSVVREHYQDKVPDVLFSEWLLHECRPEFTDSPTESPAEPMTP
jgi:hypothetical protein